MSEPAPDWLEQARRLLAGSGLAEALGTFGAGVGGAAGTGAAPGTPPADHSAECRWCPVCVGLAALRGHRPDLLEGLADVLATAAAALRAQAAAGGSAAEPPVAGDRAPDEAAPGATAPDATGPESTAPDATGPGATAPDAGGPGERAAGDRSGDAPAGTPEEPGTGPSPAPVQRIEVA
jgi:hypothetical protein